MFTIRIADLNVQINNSYELIREKCAPYVNPNTPDPDLIVEATAADRAYSKNWILHHDGRVITDAEAEYDRAHYHIYTELYRFRSFWLHACVVELDGVGYAFSAPPGIGKTTHVQRWLQAFPGRAHIINGDNPIVREWDGVYYAYGTPFCGKEGYQENRRVPLAGVCFLQRAENNSVSMMEPMEAMFRLHAENWTIDYSNSNAVDAYLDIYTHFVETVPVYLMRCNNMKEDAAFVSYEAMHR